MNTKRTMPQDPRLLDSIQSEVASEASPFLELLVRNAKYIALFFVLFLLAIVGYWWFSTHSEKQKQANLREYGALLVISSAKDRQAALEQFIEKAPSFIRTDALFALAITAQEAEDFEKAFATWSTIRKEHPELAVQAALGQTKSLMAQNKLEDALALLEGVLPGVTNNDLDRLNINLQIVAIAEALGNYDRAIIACETLAASYNVTGGTQQWRQKLVTLREKAAAKGAE